MSMYWQLHETNAKHTRPKCYGPFPQHRLQARYLCRGMAMRTLSIAESVCRLHAFRRRIWGFLKKINKNAWPALFWHNFFNVSPCERTESTAPTSATNRGASTDGDVRSKVFTGRLLRGGRQGAKTPFYFRNQERVDLEPMRTPRNEWDTILIGLNLEVMKYIIRIHGVRIHALKIYLSPCFLYPCIRYACIYYQ